MRMIVVQDVFADFAAALTRCAAEMRPGDPRRGPTLHAGGWLAPALSAYCSPAVLSSAGEGPELLSGGVKRSGFGRELGPLGIDEFANERLLYVK